MVKNYYCLYNPKNGLMMLTDQLKDLFITMRWGQGTAVTVFNENELEKFLRGNYKFIDRSDESHRRQRECTPEEISEWIIVLWYNGQLDFTDTFTVKEFLVGV